MTNKKLKNVLDVARWQLCVGCGACAYICSKGHITLRDEPSRGIRPVLYSGTCDECSDCMKVCPGHEISHHEWTHNGDLYAELLPGWGRIIEIWEGYAADPDIRHKGSSGGLASALALFCIEKGDMYGVLHIGADPDDPFRNKTVLSRTREDILSRTGSRYSPASPCDSLSQIENSPGPCVFIGKPCDVTALRKAQLLRPELSRRTGLAISIFCAGTPSTQGTLSFLSKLGISPDEIDEIRYRGEGWPGSFKIKASDGKRSAEKISYSESWGFLQKYRPYRCHLCPDGTGEFADLSCGDPWYRKIEEGEEGYSMVLVRSERGREILRKAIEAGYVCVERADPAKLINSQKNLLLKRSAVWGRVLAMKSFGVPAPRLEGFSLFRNWARLSMKDKLRSTLGTARRIIQRKYYRPVKPDETEYKY